MRINANSPLTLEDAREAINRARGTHGQDIYLSEGWQTPRGRVEFYCDSAHGKYTATRGGKAATWTAWGWVIAELFARDSHAVIGQYRGRDHFIQTIYREQACYIRRETLGMPDRTGRGSDCSFLSLFSDEDLTRNYHEARLTN